MSPIVMEPPALNMHHLSRIQQQFSSTPTDQHAPSSDPHVLHQRISSGEFTTYEQLLKDRTQQPAVDDQLNTVVTQPQQPSQQQSDQPQSHPPEQVAAPPPPQPAQPQQQPQQAPQQQRTGCTNCGTVDTPLWRRDAQGKTICNACGELIASTFISSAFISSPIPIACQRVARLGSRAPVSSRHVPCYPFDIYRHAALRLHLHRVFSACRSDMMAIGPHSFFSYALVLPTVLSVQ